MEAYGSIPGRGRPDNPVLVAEMRDRIARQGRITFAEFMEVALYYPDHGYYSAPGEKFGPAGDFFTSPELHPLFGALLARQLEEMWRLMGSPRPFTVVEVGPGRGTLARDILSYAPHLGEDFDRSLNYHLVEVSSALQGVQQQALVPWAGKVDWADSLRQLPPASVVGCLIANELLDALPVHVVAMRDGCLREVYVDWSADRFVEVMHDPSTPELDLYFDRLGIRLPEGCRAEVNLGASDWLAEAAAALQRGYGLVIDYGDLAADLYSERRPRGTLLCHYRHTVNENPYRRLGSQDITAHVDFTNLAQAAQRVGLGTVGPVSQREFLLNLGLAAYVEALGREGLPMVVHQANRATMQDLAAAEGLGGFLVLAFLKGVPAVPLAGFAGPGEAARVAPLPVSQPVPLLPPPPVDPGFAELWDEIQWGKDDS